MLSNSSSKSPISSCSNHGSCSDLEIRRHPSVLEILRFFDRSSTSGVYLIATIGSLVVFIATAESDGGDSRLIRFGYCESRLSVRGISQHRGFCDLFFMNTSTPSLKHIGAIPQPRRRRLMRCTIFTIQQNIHASSSKLSDRGF